MEYSIRELARLSGVTTRTLRWYDEINLLKPARTANNGCRYYTETEVEQLRDILFYRSLGIERTKIRAFLEKPSCREKMLRLHLNTLKQQRAQLDELIQAVEDVLQEENMGKKKGFEALKRQAVEENEQKYGQEVRTKYGNDEADAANATMMNLSEEAYRRWKELDDEILSRLEAAVSAEIIPQSEEGSAIAQLHKEWIGIVSHGYDVQRHRGIVRLYVMDERFTAYYDKNVAGCACFLRDAVLEWIK